MIAFSIRSKENVLVLVILKNRYMERDIIVAVWDGDIETLLCWLYTGGGGFY